jgi:hypothetical protein
VLYGALVTFTPLRGIIFQAKEVPQSVDVTVTGDRLEEVVDYIRERGAEDVEEQVEELFEIEEELEHILDIKSQEFEEFETEKVKDAPAEALEAQAEALAAQERAIARQTEALKAQTEGTPSQVQAAQQAAHAAQVEAMEAQAKAEMALAWTDASFDEAKRAQGEANQLQSDADMAQREAHQAQRRAEKAEQQARQSARPLDDARERAAQTQAAAQKAEAAAAEAQATAERTGARADRAAAQRARGQARKAQSEARRAEEQARRIEGNAERAREAADKARAEARKSQESAREAQQRARDAQAKAQKAAAKAASGPGAGDQAPAEGAQPPADSTPPSLEGMDLAGLYETAAQTEQQLTETYKRVRATELAMIQGVPLGRALESTQVAKPIRPPLNTRLLRSPIRTGGALQAHKREMEKAIEEIGSMVSLGRTMLAAARDLVGTGEGGFTVSLDQVRARAEHYQQMAQLAAEDAAARAKDLSGLMKDSPGAASGLGQMGAGTGPQSTGTGDGKGGPSGPPGISPRYVKALPGRKILSSGQAADWMFVDSWYCIGPFPNPMRRYIDTKFPPETVVDLDATYTGKGGQEIRWEFMQELHMPCVPLHAEPYAIYYAYTELYSDKPRDLWIAIGSDDKSKVWINDQQVWTSGSQHKGWRVDEGFRKVHFRKGFNKVLLRLENGHLGTAFSLVVCAKPDQ